MTSNGPRRKNISLVALAGLAAVVGAIMLRLINPGSQSSETSGDEPITSSVKAINKGGETRLIVPPAALRASGISVAPLRSATAEPSVTAFATVLQPQTLLEQRRAILSAIAERGRARAAAAAASVQARRLSSLYSDNAIVSRRELEAAQVAAASERAGVQNGDTQVALLEATAAQQWGPVIARWLVSGSPQLALVFDGRELLLQIAPSHQLTGVTPAVVQLTIPPGARIEGTVISASPQADAQFQTRTYFALAPANSQLLPGMTVPARFPIGRPIHGVEIPSAAIVRWNGGTYVYVSMAPNLYVRRPVSTEFATTNGWIDATLAPGTPIVIAGGQLLLSEELRSSRGGPVADR